MSRARKAQGRRALLQIALRRPQLDGLLLAHMPSYLHMLTTRALHLAGSHARRGKDGSPALFEVEMESPVTWGLRGSLSVLPFMIGSPAAPLGRRVNERKHRDVGTQPG